MLNMNDEQNVEKIEEKIEEKSIKMFYGEQEVVALEEGVISGTKRIKTNSEAFDLPDWEANVCLTSWPTDISEVRNLRAIYAVDKIYDVLKELNIRVTANEMQFLLQKLLTKVEGVRKQAMLNCYGVSVEEDIRLSSLEEKLKK